MSEKPARGLFRALAFIALFLFSTVSVSNAQSSSGTDPDATAWIQIESLPSQALALARAESYARTLDRVNAFDLGNGWFGVMLGPYPPDQAVTLINQLVSEGRVPGDSYLTAAGSIRERIYPAPGAAPAQPDPTAPVAEADPTPTPEPPQETRSEALRGERLLTQEERFDLQRALRAEGVYAAGIDGAFGRGTRSAMRAWQQSRGYEDTGILTTRQRDELMRAYNAPLTSVGMDRLVDRAAGIALSMPRGAVSFSHHEAPFSHYDGTGEVPGARVVLISQKGDRSSLYGLYDILQTLEAVPQDGPRERERDSFTIEGRNGQIVSHTEVTLHDGEVKGFMLIWPTGDEARRARILADMQGSFERLPGTLDPAAGAERTQKVNLVSGLEIRRPRLSRSGIYVDDRGAVVTTAEAVQSCGHITIDERFSASVAAMDDTLGLAVLRPDEALAPMAIARFADTPPRLRADIAVSGYSFEGLLGAPSMTFGTVADAQGPDGSADVLRLSMTTRDGDAGGPVIDDTGTVIGALMPKPENRRLPENVTLAIRGTAMGGLLEQAGVTPQRAGFTSEPLSADALARQATGMTALVGCWD
ncbi:serine protease [Chachezhania antarctica]|uniref:serine protease n=1 Tax=Chachezhania antarctica TaxID=2340860 RepID=UPI000EB0810F|nr:serine protease [Chachezhania antarctica]